MTSTAWSHLPNARHIDWVIDDLRRNPDKWSTARAAARDAAYYAAFDAIRAAAYYAARDAAYYAARDAIRAAAFDAIRAAAYYAARAAAFDAILALIAWDSASDLLDCDPEHVRILSHLGDHRAVLMLPAVMVLSQEKSLTSA